MSQELGEVTVESVKAVLVEVIGAESRAGEMDASTPLLGAIPELDSLAVAEVIVSLENAFGLEIQDSDVSAEAFETLGSLTDLIASKRA